VLRFSPVRYTPADYARVHGINERISVKACGDIATFYRRLIEACTQ
jgi:acetylornithine deacetylase/succinyl-diaminopimelate desuccinylase-like protein